MQKLIELQLSGCVFKRCKNFTYDYILALKKPKENFKCNELRRGVVNPYFAKFRCNGLIPVAIYDVFNNKLINNFIHTFLGKFTEYRVDSLVSPDSYDKNIDNICTNGIHYFLKLNAAMEYLNNEIKGYDENGKPINDERSFIYSQR